VKLIVGLGNPGKEYAGTRHNVGFELIDALGARHGIRVEQRERAYRSLIGRGEIEGQRVLLVKPQTFMNLSGEAVGAIVQREGVALTDLLVLSDDIHLPVGKVRLRGKGSSGGQNGLKNIASHLGTQEWARLRLGVGEPPPGLQVDWVLSRFSRADRKLVDDMLITGMGAVETWLTQGIEAAMNRFNADTPPV
jgi:PTH1 family peptidyl-tRNA hydrolase